MQPLRVGWYNEEVERAYRLPDFGRGDSLALVIGNSRRLWPCFVDAMRSDDRLFADANPINTYAMNSVLAAMAAIAAPTQVRWAHDTGRGMVAMQRLAHVSGLATLSPAYLSVHPDYGPWIGLRAAVVVDTPGPSARPLLEPPCDDCENACLPALAEARCSSDWRSWLAVRDACPRGNEHRYGEDQIEYHYAKDLTRLRAAVGERHAAHGGSDARAAEEV